MRLSRTGLLPKVGRDRGWGLQCRPVLDPCKSSAFEACGFRYCARSMPPHPRFLRPRPFPPRPPPPLITALFGRYYERVRLLIRSLTDCPLGFPPRPGIASATAGRMRSPRFRRLPFVRDGVFDHGRASAPRKTAPHMLPSAVSTDSASARLALSRLNSPPHTIAVYASRRSSPSAPQHSLPSARYGLLGPDLHRLDAASFAWRTDSRLFADFRAPRMAPERRHGQQGRPIS